MPGQPASVPVTIAITSMSPSYAMPGQRISIAVQVRNVSGTALSGLSVQMLSSGKQFTSRSYLEYFALGYYAPSEPALNLPPVMIGRLAAGAAWTGSISVPVSALGLTCFGVYPLTAQVSDSAGPLASDPTPLPYWPRKKSSCPIQRPKPTDISWVWPLIDKPHQGPCPGLLDNSLAATIAPTGRLGQLLAVGASYAYAARLTWAVDPALLDGVQTMRQPYLVGGNASCTGARPYPASSAATAWLHELSVATAGQTVFATPYADTDMAALTQVLRNHDLSRSFAQGQLVAGQILKRSFAPEAIPAGGRQLAAVAWPADGIANYALLENLAAIKISTVILDSSTMQVRPPVYYTPGAVTSTLDGLGTRLHFLLADDTISQWLGSRDAQSGQLSAIFKVSQMFLAETAMIVAEAPSISRSIVVAPPRRWNPTSQLASDLLAETVTARWLRPTTMSQLLALPADHLIRSQPQRVSSDELSRKLLSQVARSEPAVALLESILITPNQQLYRAVFGAESSAWRDGRAAERPAQALVTRIARFVEDQMDRLSVSGPTGVTLGGTVGSSTVAISNQLRYPVRVKIGVSSSNGSVTIIVPDKGIFTVPADETRVVKLAVHATSTGSATVTLRLTSPLTGIRLPVDALVMHVQATRSGVIALIICAGLLAVFVFTSAARAIRHGRPGPPEPADHDAGSAGGGPADRPDGGQEPDNVGAERSHLMPTGPAIAGQGPPEPGQLTTEGFR